MHVGDGDTVVGDRNALLGRTGQIRNRLLMIDLLDGSVDDMELR